MASHWFLLAKTSKTRLLVLAISIFGLAIYPHIWKDPYFLHVMILWLIWAIVTTSWAVLLGFLGIFHFAQIAFFGLGGYTTGLLSVKYAMSPWLGIPLGGLVAGLFSLGVSLPALRLKGPYIAVVSLGFSECIRIATTNLDFTKAELGVWGVPPLWEGIDKMGVYYCVLIVCVMEIFLFYTILTSRHGLAAKAIKASAQSAESIGVDIFRTKIAMFFVSSFIAGIAGAFYTHYLGGISPDIYKIGNMVDVMVMGILGGVTSVFGPVIGSFVVVFSLEKLRVLQDFRFIFYALVIITLILFKPQGIYDYLNKFFQRIEKPLTLHSLLRRQ